jgi:putative transposase
MSSTKERKFLCWQRPTFTRGKRGQAENLERQASRGKTSRMARKVRIEYEGALYHVMCRGHRRQAIYRDEEDRRIFLATLAKAVRRTGWHLHAYVLMKDHYHLLLETPKPNLVRGMAWLQTAFTVRFNARHHRSGRLFGGRYKAILVDPGHPRYVTRLLDYIHLNPVRAGEIRLGKGEHVLDYEWSSLRGYIEKRDRLEWLTVQRGFSAKDLADNVRGRRALLQQMERRANEDQTKYAGLSLMDEENPQSTLRRGWYYGRESFRDALLKKANAVVKRSRIARNEDDELEARRLIAEGLARTRMRREELRKLAKGDIRKARIAARVRATTTVSLQWVANELRMGTAGNVAQACRRLEQE